MDESIIAAMLLGDASKRSLGKMEIKKWRFILGEKGVGKTHLQNYVISHFWKDFDYNRVMWIRINLIRDYGPYESDLVDWIQAQIAKIVCRYYDNEYQ